MSDVVLEMLWDCKKCGHKGNKGRDIECSQCGFNKTEDTEYSMPEGYKTAPGSQDPELINLADSGANYVCDYCHSESRAGSFDVCPECHAPRIDVPVEGHVAIFNPSTPPKNERTPDERLEEDLMQEVERQEAQRKRYQDAQPQEFVSGTSLFHPLKNFLVVLVGIMSLALLVSVGVWLFSSKETEARVTKTQWSRFVSIARKTVKRGNDWRSMMHVEAYNTTCFPKKKGEKKCNPYKCNPHTVFDKCHCREENCRDANCENYDCVPQQNGTAKCKQRCDRVCDERPEKKCDRVCDEVCEQCPRTEHDTCYQTCDVIEDFCSYTYDDWGIVDIAETKGNDHEIFWPPLAPRGSDERIANKWEKYSVSFQSIEGKNYTIQVSETEYHRFRVEEVWKVKVSRAGGLTPVSPK